MKTHFFSFLKEINLKIQPQTALRIRIQLFKLPTKRKSIRKHPPDRKKGGNQNRRIPGPPSPRSMGSWEFLISDNFQEGRDLLS